MDGSSRDDAVGTAEARWLERREAIKAVLGVALVAGLGACAGRQGQVPAKAPDPTPEDLDAGGLEPEATTPHIHPADGDRLVFAFGDRDGQIISPQDIPAGGPPIMAYPADADASHVANESRLGQVLLVRLDPSQLSEDTVAVAADGIVAYSAICTHTGCEISDWEEDTIRFRCPCHDSQFDPLDNGSVVRGPARLRLAALPLRIDDGDLMVAGGFTRRVGAESR